MALQYQFKKKHADAIIVIPGYKKEITAKNLTDEEAKRILKKFPHLAHNIEPIGSEAEAKSDASDAAEKPARKSSGRKRGGKAKADASNESGAGE